MRYLGMALCMAALVAVACGCPQTGIEGGGETKLLKKFMEEGGTQKAIILFVKSRGCGDDTQLLWDQLKGYANLSDGDVKIIPADADEDRELKKAYGFTSYPVTMLFDAKGGYITEWEGTRFDAEVIKKKLIEMGATIRNKDEPPPDYEKEPEEKPAETPAETPEEKPEDKPEETPEEGDSGESGE